MISAEWIQFINENRNQPKSSLALRLSKVPIKERNLILNQINGYQKGKEKLPFWVDKELVFPPSLNLEQCSSELAAKLKLDFFSGKTLLDLTGGFGVDSTIAALNGFEITHVEPNSDLQNLVKENIEILGFKHVRFCNQTAESFIENIAQHTFDTVLIDPSRRDEHNRKLVSLADCVPNVLELLPKLTSITTNLVLKLSPMLDIQKAVLELEKAGKNNWFIKTLRVVSIKNECKELVFHLKSGTKKPISLQLWNAINENEILRFETLWPLPDCEFHYSNVQNYLYDVSTSIHKAQAYSAILNDFQVQKLAPQTHIFTSNILIPNFPGRVFKVIKTLAYKKIDSKLKANIILRNFPDSEPIIRKKTGILAGDDFFVFAVRNNSKKTILIVCQPIPFFFSV